MRTEIKYKNKSWEVLCSLKAKDLNTEIYKCIYGRTSKILIVDSFSGQVTEEAI